MAPFGDDMDLRVAVGRADVGKRGSQLLDLWQTRYQPEVEALTWSIRSLALAGLPLRELAARLPQVRAARRRLGELHVFALGLSGGAAGRLIRMCSREWGAEGELISNELLGGFPNKSLESAAGLWDLARAARESKPVEAALREQTPAAFLAALPALEGGDGFSARLTAYLEVFGHRNESFSELAYPTWREDPRFPLLMLRRYLDAREDASPQAMHRRTVARRQQREAEAEAKLGAGSEAWATFRSAMKDAQQRTTLLEDHNFYIDQAGPSATREFVLALADGLVATGAIAAREDVFYLEEREIAEAAAGGSGDYRNRVRERRAERERWMRVLPPATIGKAEVPVPEQMAQFFGPMAPEPMEAGAFRGVAASPGVLRGTARVILGLDDIDRLAPGEILVTYSTAPPWTPVFAIAGAIVTDSGGQLAHAAVVAREYGIPAVVGTRVATATVQDGQLITVDGTQGIVRIES
jgi:pyruvate,water dikinase